MNELSRFCINRVVSDWALLRVHRRINCPPWSHFLQAKGCRKVDMALIGESRRPWDHHFGEFANQRLVVHKFARFILTLRKNAASRLRIRRNLWETAQACRFLGTANICAELRGWLDWRELWVYRTDSNRLWLCL